MNTESPMHQMTDEEAWAFLGSHEFGRLAFHLAGEVHITPINYCADRGRLIFRTAEGNKLFTVTINSEVAFEVDGWDGTGGWSVITHGRGEEVTAASEVERLESLPLRPWVPVVKTHWVRITPTQITGRQFHFGPEPDKEYSFNSE